MVRFVNAARPPASVAIGFTPESPGPPVAMAAVTCVPARLTGLPAPSWSCTTGWRASATPLRTLSDGGATSASCTAERSERDGAGSHGNEVRGRERERIAADRAADREPGEGHDAVGVARR